MKPKALKAEVDPKLAAAHREIAALKAEVSSLRYALEQISEFADKVKK